VILDIFIDKGFALSHSDVEEKVKHNFDRVTLYRTLKTFLDKGILHKVLDDSGVTKYALCKESCSVSDHKHEHVHFKCVNCGHTNCIDDVLIPSVKLPQGYKFLESNLLIQGVCKDCGLLA